jgi:hypothetical protein
MSIGQRFWNERYPNINIYKRSSCQIWRVIILILIVLVKWRVFVCTLALDFYLEYRNRIRSYKTSCIGLEKEKKILRHESIFRLFWNEKYSRMKKTLKTVWNIETWDFGCTALNRKICEVDRIQDMLDQSQRIVYL